MDGPQSKTTPEIQDPEKIAVSRREGALISIVITTKMGERYEFPDVQLTSLKLALPESGRMPSNMPALMIVNASMAVLSVPMRIIKTITTVDPEDGFPDELWRAPGA